MGVPFIDICGFLEMAGTEIEKCGIKLSLSPWLCTIFIIPRVAPIHHGPSVSMCGAQMPILSVLI
jgi:hypothetical protein